MRVLLSIALLCLFVSALAVAQPSLSGLDVGPVSSGTEFIVSFPSNYEDPGATQQYIRLYIACDTVTDVRVHAAGQLKRTVRTTANGIVTVDLTKHEAQAVSRPNTTPVPGDQVLTDRAVRVSSDAPIVVYGMNRTSYTSDGMLVLPVAALGTEYVVATARDAVSSASEYRLPSQYLVAAAFDSTTVRVRTAATTPSHAEGDTFTVVLNRGDVFTSMSSQPNGDLSGTTISASRPVAVTAGASCTFLPDGRYMACDHLAEMLLPVSSWGETILSIPHATRVKGDLYRIYASAPNTEIFINGTKVATLNGPGGAEGLGWMQYLPTRRGPIAITGSEPILVAQYNNSQGYDNVPSDPFYAVLLPIEQYRTTALFTTPAGDFPQNYVGVITDSAGFDSLELAPAGTQDWRRVAELNQMAPWSVPGIVAGDRWRGASFSIAPGSYQLRSTRPFGATLYGFGNYDSYGYPLAALTADLSTGDTSVPGVQIPDDGTATRTITIVDEPGDPSRRANLSDVVLVRGSDNWRLEEVTPVIPGVTRSATYRMRVVDTTRAATGVLATADMAGNVRYDTVRYAAPGELTLIVTGHDFGSRRIGTSTTADSAIRILNIGGPAVTITEVLMSGDAAFPMSAAGVIGTTINAGEAFLLSVAFEPTEVRSYSATVTFRFDPDQGGEYSAQLVGVGVDTVSAVRGLDDESGVAVELDRSGGELRVTGLRACGDLAVSLVAVDGRTVASWERMEAGPSGTLRLDLTGIPTGWHRLRITGCGRTTSVTVIR